MNEISILVLLVAFGVGVYLGNVVADWIRRLF